MKYTFDVPDMSCEHCKSTIEKALSSKKSITGFEVDLEGKKVHVETEEPAEMVQKLLDDAGYPAQIYM
ncbi:heavy-metal-associated domain-containing protein [Geotoga petraea]|uniref:Copper chaperone n=1 Tax=Geotoga petraea TaxID=28234 RepID=A0A1G6N660_9BACT|nr:heavy metal-associated domain-containing protein [Geotoga petraea]MDK2945526.1 copper chaperone [Geotoga sp.]TGG87231.1 heavy-metal-associated domain-containing protein [Geotoga petraea]SDC62914.1 copper chaperone [Geotoga petraea]